MKKLIIILAAFTIFAVSAFSQTDDELFGGDSFTSDDDLFGGDDDLFFDDGIDIVEDISAKSDLSKGVLFENGSIKIGGSFSTGLSTQTTLYADDEKSFGEHLKDTTLSPLANAYLTLDARPTQTLRMYTKFGIAYPYKTIANSYLQLEKYTISDGVDLPYPTNVSTSVKDWFSLKELFTDFSIGEQASFRFGYHTVTWGTGYFFSPVSDMINTSSINPEDVSEQVNGSLNLRTQITFPDTQNCLWLYVIPSTESLYLRDTAFAAKTDLVFGTWEFGLGGFWKYQNSPKAMLTATGSIKNFSLFGEFVYSYGAASEWNSKPDSWEDKTNIFQATAGLNRYWKDQNILLAAQYYYDGNEKDVYHQYLTYGHNVAVMANFGRLFGTTDFTAALFGMANFGRDDFDLFKFAAQMPLGNVDMANADIESILESYGISSSFISQMILSALVYYSPINEFKVGFGPYITFLDFDSAPKVSLKLDFTLGGGKF